MIKYYINFKIKNESYNTHLNFALIAKIINTLILNKNTEKQREIHGFTLLTFDFILT